MRLQPHFIKHAGDVVQPIRSHVDDNPLPMNKTVKMHASPPRAKSSSSSAVITSSASNHSFTMTEQNENRSSKTNESESTSPPIVRYTNKLLTENSIRLIELQSPGMTTHERVLNWRIADDFSDIDDGYDESLCTQSQPFRSERVSKIFNSTNWLFVFIFSSLPIFSCRNAFISSQYKRSHRRPRNCPNYRWKSSRWHRGKLSRIVRLNRAAAVISLNDRRW